MPNGATTAVQIRVACVGRSLSDLRVSSREELSSVVGMTFVFTMLFVVYSGDHGLD